jgi:6-phosphogluconate dehydrogenase (decarboxylating)
MMDIAMIGLGKMGANMAKRLLRASHRVVAYDLNEAAIQSVEAGAESCIKQKGEQAWNFSIFPPKLSKFRKFRLRMKSACRLRKQPW